MTISAFTFRFAVPGALDCSIIEDNCEFCIPLEVCHTPLHNIIIAQHYNATQSGKVSPTNANWNLIAFQWKLMLQKMFATWRPQRNNLLQFIFSPTFLTNEVNVFFQLQFFYLLWLKVAIRQLTTTTSTTLSFHAVQAHCKYWREL